MERLEDLCWRAVKEGIFRPEKKKTWKEIRKEMETGERKKDTRKNNIIELAKEVGWLAVLKTAWKIEMKKEMWCDIHRDIVSTHYPIVTQWNTCIEGNNVVYCLF